MPPQWIRGEVPKTAKRVRVGIIGPEDFDDYKYLAKCLDNATLKFEHVEAVIWGNILHKEERNGEWHRLGVPHYADRWAEYHWWTRHHFLVEWYGKGPKAEREAKEAFLKTLGSNGYCMAFYDYLCEETEEMMELVRESIPFSHFKIAKC